MTNPSQPRRRSIAFVASREPSYARVAILRDALESQYEVQAFVSPRSQYALRVVSVLAQFSWAALRGRLRHVDLVVVSFLAQPLLPFVRLLWRGPLIADAFVSLFDTLVGDKQIARSGGPIAAVAHWLDYRLVQQADLVVTDTAAHCRYLSATFGGELDHFDRIFASAQSEIFKRLPVKTHQPGKPFEVLFWGAYIPLQGVEVIVEAAQYLAADEFRFTLVGAGQTADRCQRLAEKLQLPHLRFLGWQPPEELVEQSRHAHLLLGIFGTTDKAARVIPNKAFQALALGKPLITGDSPAARELLRDQQNALLVPRGDPSALADCIRWSAANYDRVLEIAACGWQTFQEQASPSVVARDLSRSVEKVSSETE